MRDELRQQFEKSLSIGQIQEALAVLDRALYESTDERGRRDILDLLIKTCSDQFLHRRALNYAQEHERILGLKRVPWFISFLVGYWICLRFLLGLKTRTLITRLLFRGILKSKKTTTFEEVTSLLYANYWYSIRKSAIYSFLQIELSENKAQELMSIGNLAYTLAYAGHGWIGITTIKKVLRIAEENESDRVRFTFAMHLGIAQQMNFRFSEALQTFHKFEDSFPSAPHFFRSISLGNQITTNVGLSDFVAADKAIDRAFSFSFAQRENRAHIQIFGFKALLLAIEGRTNEARSFITRALSTAAQNDSPLDKIIAHRIASLVFLSLNDLAKVDEHLSLALSYSKEYGHPFFYRSELNSIRFFADLQKDKTRLNVIRLGFQLLAGVRFHPLSLVRSLKFLGRVFLDPTVDFWARDSVTRYFEYRLKSLYEAPDYGVLRSITEGAEKILPNSADINSPKEPCNETLAAQLSAIFKNTKIWVKDSLDTLVETLREEELVEGFIGTSSTGDSVKAPCKEGYFIGIMAPQAKEIPEPLAVGLLLPQLNTFTESFVESVVRILLANHVFSQAVHRSRDQLIRDEQNRTLANLAREFAHDIRDPLSTIDKLIEASPQTSASMKNLMRAALTRIQDSANDILIPKNSKPQDLKKMSQDIESEMLSDLIEPIVSEKRVLFKDQKDVMINCEEGNSYGLFAKVHSNDFQRLLSNIITNAVQATDGKGRVDIAWTRVGNRAVVRVKDNGKGIPEEILPHLGEEEYTFEKPGGTGLGLFRAKRVVKSWGGTLKIASRLGVGTVVEISLPTSQPPKWFVPEIVTDDYSTIVVTDDEPFQHEIWKRRFRRFQGKLLHLTSGRQLLEWVGKKRKLENVLFLCDYELKGEAETGFDLIKKLGIENKAILVTGHARSTELQAACKKFGLRLLAKELTPLVPVREGRSETIQPNYEMQGSLI